MPKHERQNRPHDQEMPQPRQVEAAHHPRQPRKLHRLPYRQTGKHRQYTQPDYGRVRMLLQWVVGFLHRWLRSEEKVMANHRPHSGYVPWHKQNLLIVAAENLVAEIQQPRRHIDPHEGEVPLQGAAQPSAQRERLGPVEQIFLRDFRAEAWKSAKDLESAAYQHE